jgi:hypothetical protein
MVMESVMVILDKEATWSNMKKELANPNFLDLITNFDKGNIS